MITSGTDHENVHGRQWRRHEQLQYLPYKRETDLAVNIDIGRILRASPARERSLFRRCLQGATTIGIARDRDQSVTPTAIRLRLLRARRAAFEKLIRVVARRRVFWLEAGASLLIPQGSCGWANGPPIAEWKT